MGRAGDGCSGPPRGPRFRAPVFGIERRKAVRTLMYRIDIGRRVEWIKLSPRYLLPLSLFTGFILFAPKKWLAVFGLLNLVTNKRG